MRIFLSYSRADAAIAEQITVNLKQAGHDVFFDKYGIDVAEDFNRVIWKEIRKAALFIFLISPNSVKSGSYALTELALAEKKWPNPQWRVLSVVVEATDYTIIPVYASLCHILHPKGNLSSEVRDEVNALNNRHRIRTLVTITAIVASLALAGSLLHIGYREFLAQQPLAARERLAAMNLFNPEAFVDSAFKGDLKLMQLYLTAGMDPNAAKRDHTTALMSAVQGNHIVVVEMLLSAGADVNTSRLLTHNTALDDAATTGQEATLQMLLEAGANSDTVDRAFVRAVAHQEMRCFYILLDHGVTQTAIDSAFVVAAANDDHALLQTLSDRITDQSHTASEALLEIAGIPKKKFRQIPEATRTETFKYLIARGADVNAWNENGFTPLGLAVSNQNLKLAQLLLANNANIDMHSKCMGRVSGWTPLTLAISTKASAVGDDDLADASSMIGLLLESGADVNLAKLGCRKEKTRHDETPLMLAANEDDLQLVRRLLNKGAKVDSQDSRGFTALAYGASNRNMLAELLANNADIDVGNNPLVLAIEQNNYQAVENLLEAGANVNKKDSEGTTPLMLAVKVSSPDILMLLLSAGARTSDKDNMGRTAEMLAMLKHADEMVALLRNAER